MSLQQLKNTGNPDIDAAHEKMVISILQILSLLEEKKVDRIYVLEELINLFHIFIIHKNEEETLMDMIEYPYADIHKAIHETITLKIRALILFYTLPVTKISWLLNSLKDLLIDHVEQYDLPLFAYNEQYQQLNTRLV